MPAPSWSFDLATYYNVYKGLPAFQAGTPYFASDPIPHLVLPEIVENGAVGDTYGAELSAQWRPVDYWRLMASYSWLHMRLTPDDSTAGDSPQDQFQIRSYLDLLQNVAFSSALYFVDRLPNQPAPSYFRLDLGLNWRVNKSWEIGVFGQNLTDGGHFEFSSFFTGVHAEIPRSVFGKITFRF